MITPKDISNKKYGLLTPIKIIGSHPKKGSIWLCQCDCGNTHNVSIAHLNNGNVISCGCYRKDHPAGKTHGMTKSKIYGRWRNMLTRCYDKNYDYYERYGGRGVKVCDRWLNSFENFYADMGSSYKDELQLDRINNDGDYEPTNCKWSTTKEQKRNFSMNKWIEYNGERKIITDWSLLSGVGRVTIMSRLERGWEVGEAIFKKPDSFKYAAKHKTA